MYRINDSTPAEGRQRRRPAPFYLVLLGSVLTLLTGAAVQGREPALQSTPDAATVLYLPIIAKATVSPASPAAGGPIYGVNFINSAEHPASAQQYQNGLSTGARWNRWPIYWFNIEQNPGQFNWSAQDAAVQADVAHGLKTNAILLGTPPFYLTALGEFSAAEAREQRRPRARGMFNIEAVNAATPAGLYQPIFSDGSDVPGPGKVINPANVWARFVYMAVNRYKPGGALAQARGWPAGAGITHWEMWNEPDLRWFWDASLEDYARLLKVGYLAARQADANAQILFAGLANNFEHLSYYNDVLNLYDQDPLAPGYNYFHDILATHSYFYAWQSWYHVFRADNAMKARGWQKPIWLNETGVPAWNDYPGPVWDPRSGLRATLAEQADYIIQSAFYAVFAGADAIFYFQLYDGCGNQPEGTDFPPHNGELCDANGKLISDGRFPCAGDANGLYRNPPSAACFRQHPQAESARPNLKAFQVLTTYLTDVAPLWRQRPGGQEWIAFYRPATRQRIVGLWTRFGQAETAVVPAVNGAGVALLVSPDGHTQTIQAVNGHYTIPLPAATNQNAFWDPALFAIGGRPFILVETDTTPAAAEIAADNEP